MVRRLPDASPAITSGNLSGVVAAAIWVDRSVRDLAISILRGIAKRTEEGFDDTGLLGRTWSTNSMTLWASVMLAASLLLYYL